MRGSRRFFGSSAVVIAALLVTSCSSTYRTMSVEEKRTLLAELEEAALAKLVEQHPEAETDMDKAVGYAIFSNTATKVPFVGAGDGIGVVVNRTNGRRTYLKVRRFDVGGGLGARKYTVVMIFFDDAALQKLASGKLELGAGVEAGAGKGGVEAGTGGSSGKHKDGYVLYQLSEGGVSATWTVRVIRYSVLDLGD